jgi:hypothetical protein
MVPMRTEKMEKLIKRFFRKRFPGWWVRKRRSTSNLWKIQVWDQNWENRFTSVGLSREDVARKIIFQILRRFCDSEDGTPEELELLLESEGI